MTNGRDENDGRGRDESALAKGLGHEFGAVAVDNRADVEEGALKVFARLGKVDAEAINLLEGRARRHVPHEQGLELLQGPLHDDGVLRLFLLHPRDDLSIDLMKRKRKRQ